MLHEEDLFDIDLQSVSHGEMRRADGRLLHLGDIIKRRWGWPKKAATIAGRMLHKAGEAVQLNGKAREAQQNELFQRDPQLAIALLSGLARGSTREMHDVGRVLDHVQVKFDCDIYEDGLITRIIYALAERFGLNYEEMRGRIKFHTGALGERVLFVDVEGIENEDL